MFYDHPLPPSPNPHHFPSLHLHVSPFQHNAKLQTHKIFICLMSDPSPISAAFFCLFACFVVFLFVFRQIKLYLHMFSFPLSLSTVVLFYLIYLLFHFFFNWIFSLTSSPQLSSFLFHLAPPFSSFSYLSHLLITLGALIFTSPSLSPSWFLYHHLSHIMLAWLMVQSSAYWILIRVCLLSCGFEYWIKSYAGLRKKWGVAGGQGCLHSEMDGGDQGLDWQGKW